MLTLRRKKGKNSTDFENHFYKSEEILSWMPSLFLNSKDQKAADKTLRGFFIPFQSKEKISNRARLLGLFQTRSSVFVAASNRLIFSYAM